MEQRPLTSELPVWKWRFPLLRVEAPLGPSTNAVVSEESRAEAVFPLVYRTMLSFTGRSCDLDDLVQTANEQVLRSLASFEGRGRFSTWVYRVCYLTLLQ